MSLYELLMVWLLPLCWPLGIGALAAYTQHARILLIVPLLGALFCMAALPPPVIYVEWSPTADWWHIQQAGIKSDAAHMHVVSLVSGVLWLGIAAIVREVIPSLIAAWYRSPPEPDQPQR